MNYEELLNKLSEEAVLQTQDSIKMWLDDILTDPNNLKIINER